MLGPDIRVAARRQLTNITILAGVLFVGGPITVLR